ncbi:hypothetical protein V8E52_008646 [Russula decolorans]|jgi:hypothetical protein
MSHSYHLRPNGRGRMQRQLDGHVAASGEQNKDKIAAVPSNTGQGVDDSDSRDSPSGLGSEWETVARDTTPSPRGQVWPSSHLHAPKHPWDIEQDSEYMPEGSFDSSSSDHVSPALIAERKKALKAHLEGDVEDRRRFWEEEYQKLLRQANNEEERVAIMRGGPEELQFRPKRPDIFGFPAESVPEYFDPLSPEAKEMWGRTASDSAAHVAAGYGSLRPRTGATGRSQEATAMYAAASVAGRQGRGRRRNGLTVCSGSRACSSVAPLWELRSIDGDGDSVMGSDD